METNVNEKYGFLTVKEITYRPIKSTPNKLQKWAYCLCDCGNYTFTTLNRLRTGNTKSCGCYKKKRLGDHRRKHGYAGTKIYMVFRGIINRCNNPKTKAFKYYGLKGISICDEWRNNPLEFIEWAFLNGYREGLSIERKDISGNYEPSNCRWATYLEQANNKSNNVILELDGQRETLASWSKITGLDSETIIARIRKRNWSVRKALTEPLHINQHG